MGFLFIWFDFLTKKDIKYVFIDLIWKIIMKKIEGLNLSFFLTVLTLLVSIIALVFNYQSLKNAEVSLFWAKIYLHSTYLKINKQLQDDIELNMNKEFTKEDMKNCGLTEEQIWMTSKLNSHQYKTLKKNCMTEKINPTNKNWYDGEITILKE